MRWRIWHLMLLGPPIAMLCRWPAFLPLVGALAGAGAFAALVESRFRLGWRGAILSACIMGLVYGLLIPPIVHTGGRPGPPKLPSGSAPGPMLGVESNPTVVPDVGEFAGAKDEDFSER